MTPADVAAHFRVDPKTVTRWAKEGKLPVAMRTFGGHRRYRRSEVEAADTALRNPNLEELRAVERLENFG
jgi:excisionase family DNA binding protein